MHLLRSYKIDRRAAALILTTWIISDPVQAVLATNAPITFDVRDFFMSRIDGPVGYLLF